MKEDEECKHELKKSDCADCNGDAKRLDDETRYARIDSAFYDGGLTGGVFGGGSSG